VIELGFESKGKEYSGVCRGLIGMHMHCWCLALG
jgi:hypothetical protein